ncbi:hypothetical protein ACFWUZ_34645 [Streptomyces sp. NPDC058646]|uniref:hypothetical protein n=1 Tax=Streptomyces sp. NPDC058646 TaxID=3346574 RepID=UPI00364AC534
MLTDQVTWREISNAADLALVGGYRVLAEWHCVAAAQRPMPGRQGQDRVREGAAAVGHPAPHGR